MKKIERIKDLVPFKLFTPGLAIEQVRHLTEDVDLYEAGRPRYICSLLGALYEELQDRPELQHLILEATWIARRMNDAGEGQRQDKSD